MLFIILSKYLKGCVRVCVCVWGGGGGGGDGDGESNIKTLILNYVIPNLLHLMVKPFKEHKSHLPKSTQWRGDGLGLLCFCDKMLRNFFLMFSSISNLKTMCLVTCEPDHSFDSRIHGIRLCC